MLKPDSPSATDAFEAALRARAEQHYELRLYIAGVTPRSQEALRNVMQICEQRLAGRYTLQVIDLYQNPVLAAGEQIIAAPTLIRALPLPLRKLIGSMADQEKVLVGLDLKPIEPP